MAAPPGDEPECDPPPSVVSGGETEALGVLTEGVVTVGVLTRGVVTGPTVIDGVVTEGTATVGTETAGTVTVGTETVGTVTVGTEIVGPAASAVAAALAETSNAVEAARTRSRIPPVARATGLPHHVSTNEGLDISHPSDRDLPHPAGTRSRAYTTSIGVQAGSLSPNGGVSRA